MLNIIVLFVAIFNFQTDTPTPTLTPTPTGAPYCEISATPFEDQGIFQKIEFNTPTPGATATPDGTLTPFPTAEITPSPIPTLNNHVYLTNPSNLFNGTRSVATNNYSFDLGYFPVTNCANGDKILLAFSRYSCTGIQCNNIRTQYGGYELYGTNYFHKWTENSVSVQYVPTAIALMQSSYPEVSSASNQYYNNMPDDNNIYQRFSGGPQNGTFTVSNDYIVKACYGNANYPTPTMQPTPIIPTITPTYCKIPEDMLSSDPLATFEYDVLSQSCYQLLEPINIDWSSMPTWITNIINGLGATGLNNISFGGFEVCVTPYDVDIQLLGVDIMWFITAMVGLVTLGLMVGEFRR